VFAVWLRLDREPDVPTIVAAAEAREEQEVAVGNARSLRCGSAAP
jgi:hypothetical protein